MDGWIKLHRQILEHSLWTQEPFTRGQAWVDLVLIANHKDGIINVRDHVIQIKRGQVGWSENRLAQKWKWSRTKTRNFLKYLETGQQILVDKSKSTSVITILNYDKYQAKEQQEDNRKTTERQQEDTNKNDNKEKNILSNDNTDESESFGNSDINRLLNGVNDNLRLKLPIDAKARRSAKTFLTLLTRRSKTGEPKEGREFLNDDLWVNVNDFFDDYLKFKVQRGYDPQSWYTVIQNLKLWIANRGDLEPKK